MDYYKVLGISRNVSNEEIHAAYRKMAIKYHPDKNQGREKETAEKFKEIVTAFEVLGDPSKRHRYNIKHPVRKPKRKKKEKPSLASDPNRGNIRTPPPPLRDIWGKPLTPAQRQEWSDGMGWVDAPVPNSKPKKKPKKKIPPKKGFIDSYANSYENNKGMPDIR